MTTLEAVNEILSGLGQPPVTALDTGTTSEAGEAEAYLNRSTRRIQRDGWSFNRLKQITLSLPDRTVSCSGGSGTFTYGEVVTQTTSGATGTFYYEESGKVYLKVLAGTFDGTHALTGGTSGATRATTTATAAITTAKHAVAANVLTIKAWSYSTGQMVMNSGFLYDTINNTYTFSVELVVDQVVAFSFANVPEYMHEYIVADAAVQYQRYKRRGMVDDQMLIQELSAARTKARRSDQDVCPTNVLDTADADRARGYRSRIMGR